MKKIILVLLYLCSFAFPFKAFSQNEFITEWRTVDGLIIIPTSANTLIFGETSAYTYNYNIEWYNKATGVWLGSDSGITGNYVINYVPTDTVEVRITGTFPHFYMNDNATFQNKKKLIHVKQWGNIQWKNFKFSFYGCSNLKTVPNQGLDLSQVKNMAFMFNGATLLNSDISAWDVSQVTNMQSMFNTASSFNQDLSGWDVSNVTNMGGLFYKAFSFNSDLSAWNVSKVTDMNHMFNSASSFNADISAWDVSKVINMNAMFISASSFNQDLSPWNILKVNTMSNIFKSSNMSYCNMDAILNAWAPILLSKTYNIDQIPTASSHSETVRIGLGSRLFLATPAITNPIVNTIVFNSNTGNCLGTQVAFTATSTYATNYKWNNAFVGNTYSITLTQDTLITIVAFDSLNCKTYDSLTITAFSAPTISLTSDAVNEIVCENYPVAFTATGGNTYEWNGSTDAATISIIIPFDTTIIVKGIDVNGCAAFDTLEVTTIASPAITIAADASTICNGNEVQLTASGADAYIWSTQKTEEEITVAPTETSTYTVTGIGANGCENTASVEIVVKECAGLVENSISVSVYPNPATEYVIVQTQYVDFAKASIALLDVMGKVLANANVMEENTILFVANYPAGVYFIKIQAGNNMHVEKIIKR